jgi:hypothetical protein
MKNRKIMKNICKKIVLILALFGLIVTSCEKDFLDINDDPNAATTATIDLVFPAAVASTVYVVGTSYQILGGFWAQFWTQSNTANQYKDIDSYDIQNDIYDEREYGELYTGALNDYKYIRNKAEEEKNWSYYLMATVMQAYTFQVLSDIYEEIVFTDALKGNEGNIAPEFDDQETVYNGLITMIDEALAKDLTAETVETPGDEDYLFGGNLTNWIQFANTLKLKIYLRQSYVRPSVAQAGIEAMDNAGDEFLTIDAAMTQWADQQEKRNPLYERQLFLSANNETASYTILSFLLANVDPRVDAFFSYPVNTGGAGPHAGLYQGDFNNLAVYSGDNDLSLPIIGPLDPVILMSAAESYFLQAEAVARGWLSGDAQQLYEAGIEESFTSLNVAGADVLYGAGGVYEYDGATVEEQVEDIIVQKRVAMINTQNLEAWIEQNRTHYPRESAVPASNESYIPGQLTVAVNNVTSGLFPKRLQYTNSEVSRNPKTPTLKPLTTKMWWDAK